MCGDGPICLREPVRRLHRDPDLVGELLDDGRGRGRASCPHLNLVGKVEPLGVRQHGGHGDGCSAHIADLVSGIAA